VDLDFVISSFSPFVEVKVGSSSILAFFLLSIEAAEVGRFPAALEDNAPRKESFGELPRFSDAWDDGDE
jgi:hypothetical protein